MPGRIEQQLSAYLDGELTPDEMAEVRHHLERSEELRRALGELQETKMLLGRLRAPELPRAFEVDLRARIDAPAPWRVFGWLPRPAVALATIVLAVILVGTSLFLGYRDRLRAAEVSPDVFIRAAAQAAADDPFMDRAYLGLVSTDANVRLAGEEPRETRR